ENIFKRTYRGDVRHDAGLIIGGSPAIKSVATFGCLERRRVPQRFVARGLHVAVCVQKNRRLAVAGFASGEYSRLAKLVGAGDRGAKHADFFEHPCSPRKVRYCLGASLKLRLVESGPRDARNPYEFGQIRNG